MLKITEQYIPKGNKNRPAHPMSPKYITIHDTGNASKGSGAKNHAIYAGRGVNEVGYHFVVDDKNIYQLLPLTENAWHAGDGGSGTGNRQSIAIEICENPESNRTTAEKNAQQLAAYLMKKYGIPTSNIKQHHDWNGKNCPHIIRARKNGWNDFIAAIKKEYEALVNPSPTKPSTGGKIEKGDIVHFAGGKVYASSTATAATSTRGASKCKVTATAPGAKHPFHCISEDGKGVYGWVDAAAIEQNGEAAPVQPVNRYRAGRKIAISNASLYASSTAKTAARKLSGTYYLYDGKAFSGRYRITPRADWVGKTPIAGYVTGYIGQADIPPH